MIDFDNFSCALRFAFDSNHLSEVARNEETVKQFCKLTELLLSVGETTNLTAIHDVNGIILKHYVDSLVGNTLFTNAASVIDIGCGPGFPSLPLAIVRSDLKLTALDSTAKKVEFVKLAAKELKLANITTLVGRAEELGHTKMRESFDVATARAVARLNILCELALPFVKVGGRFIAYKSKDAEDEIRECTTQNNGRSLDCLSSLGGRLSDIVRSELIGNHDSLERISVVIEKIGNTPESYPRTFAKIKKSPL